MSGGGDSPGLNLAPFLDFLTSVISFLLMTAMWVYINKIETKQSLTNAAPTEMSQNQEKPKEEIIAEAWMTKDRSYFKVFSSLSPDTALYQEDFSFKIATGFNEESVKSQIKSIKEKYPKIKPVVIHCDDDVQYEHIVQMMDSFRLNKLWSVGLAHDG